MATATAAAVRGAQQVAAAVQAAHAPALAEFPAPAGAATNSAETLIVNATAGPLPFARAAGFAASFA